MLGPRREDTPLKIQVATFRSDVSYSDGRHPDAVVCSEGSIVGLDPFPGHLRPDRLSQEIETTASCLLADHIQVSLQDYSVSNRGLRAGLTGSPDQVAERVGQFADAGVDLLLLQCSPQLEEMERFAESVIRKRSVATAASV